MKRIEAGAVAEHGAWAREAMNRAVPEAWAKWMPGPTPHGLDFL